MGLRNRIMLLVAIGLIVATAPLGVMGLGMVRVATDRVLDERLALTRATAGQLGDRLAQAESQLDRLGARIAPPYRAGNLDAMRAALGSAGPELPLFSGGLFIVDRAGRLIQAPPASDLRLSWQDALRAAGQTLATGRPSASNLLHSAGGVPVVVLTVPLGDAGGTAVGAVGGVIDLTRPTLMAFIDGLALGVSGHAAIVDSTGTVLASTDAGELYSRNEHPKFFARSIGERRALVGPTEDDHRPGTRGEIHVMAFAPIASAPWGLGIGQNEQETFGPIRRLRDRIILFELVVILAALGFAWLDTGAVSAPLRLLKEAAERIAAGNLDHPIQVGRGDEIGTLAKSFETMRLQLRRSLEENERLQERVLSVTVLEERERIAREMHDSVGQVLGYVNTKAQAVKALLEAGDAAGAERHLAQLEQAARDVYTDLREAILSLRTTTSPDRRLIPVLQEYVGRFAELSGIHGELIADAGASEIVLSPTADLHLLRIIGEALTNVRKHAAARHAWIRLTARDGVLVTTVADDGVGFDPNQIASRGWKGFGLQTMRERAESIGATFAVRSTGGAGTEVEIRLPVPEKEVHDARAASG